MSEELKENQPNDLSREANSSEPMDVTVRATEANLSNEEEAFEGGSDAIPCDAVEETGASDTERNEALEDHSEGKDAKCIARNKPVRISVASFIFSAIALVLATLMITYTCCSIYFKGEIAKAKNDNVVAGENMDAVNADFYELSVLKSLFEQYSLAELNEEEIMTLVMKAYVYATGDRYAEYYTSEEYLSLMQDYAGTTVGIGVTVLSITETIDGQAQDVIQIQHVVRNSPAEIAGVLEGDLIVSVGTGEQAKSVDELGYNEAVNSLRGEAGTQAEFIVMRPNDNGYEKLVFSVTRAAVQTESVLFDTLESDPSVGVVRIVEFDLTTPDQLSNAVDSLKNSGCTSFVFDLRFNPGGMLSSIRAVLSYFLDEGQVILTTSNKDGIVETFKVAPMDLEVDGVSLTKEDIGKYKGLNAVVLCNGDTASAAELFVANFRDYDLGTIVGTKTFGKGSVQHYLSLLGYGINGVLKMTYSYYFPPCNEGYDGIGITPDVVVEMSEEQYKQFNIYHIEPDDQLTEALKHFR